MINTEVKPAIWISDLAAYNSGILHGEWVTLTGDTTLEELNQKVEEILAKGTRLYSKETLSDKHEEFGIFDFEGFGPIRLEEYESLETVLEYAKHICDDADKFFAFIDAMGDDYADDYEQYEVYGPYESSQEYAWNDLEELLGLGPRETLTEWLERKGMPKGIALSMKFDVAEYMKIVQNDGMSFGVGPSGKLYGIDPKR